MAFQTIHDIPGTGFGLWKIARADCEQIVYDAIAAGYRHFDSACDYGNEKEVGMGLNRAMSDGLCKREDLWITSKLWNTYHHPNHVPLALERTLSDLGLDYLDLYLIHFPIALEFVPFEERYPPEWVLDPQAKEPIMYPAKVPLSDTWKAMETEKASGKTRHIGVCNYSTSLLHDLMRYASEPPEMLQIEAHPFLSQEKLIKLAKSFDMEVTAFSPLGALSYVELDMAESNDTVLDQPTIKAVSERTGKTPAQVVLKWGIQRGTNVIVKTSRKSRMIENLALEDFTLTDEEMSAISALNINRRFNDPGEFCLEAFNTFYPIYE